MERATLTVLRSLGNTPAQQLTDELDLEAMAKTWSHPDDLSFFYQVRNGPGDPRA
jgi:hypothetical protein